jgi:hypothetical protein
MYQIGDQVVFIWLYDFQWGDPFMLLIFAVG